MDIILSLLIPSLSRSVWYCFSNVDFPTLRRPVMTYIFLDEIQLVDGFQKAVDSLYVKDNVDIYITGSNAYFLSGELATLLTGRYVEIPMFPLSFRDFYSLNGQDDKDAALREYMRYGGLPYLSVMSRTEEKAEAYLEGIYNTVIVKDIEERSSRKKTNPGRLLI